MIKLSQVERPEQIEEVKRLLLEYEASLGTPAGCTGHVPGLVAM